MTKRIIFILFFFTINVSTFAQNEKMNWYFGNYAALDFNSGSPILINTSALKTGEGSSSISDASGNLLFYTDGISVWNKNNLVMPNGSGLLGNPSTTQAALITPRPESNSQYYVFTINELGGAMTYSIVDMTLGGGLGGVILASKNTLLHPSVSEKQAAIKRCDGNIWVISHNSSDNTFFCDLITPSGINPSIISSVGLSQAGGSGPHFNTVGQLKISPLGNKLALAIRDVGVFELFDFDINTGIISNSQPLNTGNYPVAYGVEFSPDATKLYGSTIVSGQIFQFNLTLGTTVAIANSATLIGTAVAYVGDLQAAPDGKIYAAQCYNQTTGGINSLCVINSPNSLGSACGYVQSGLSLGSKSSSLGLPNLMTTNINLAQVTTSNDTTICSGQNIILTASGGDTYQWSGGSSATTSSINVSPDSTTYYFVNSTNICGSDIDTIKVIVTDCSGNPSSTDSSSTKPIGSLGYDFTNVFTPNNDGQNDYFTLNLVNAAAINLQIFNRWGNPMITITDVNSKGWDGKTQNGKEASDGTYFYLYQIKGLDGQSVKGQGFLQLIRN